ncbi:hypothetical protein [Streptomyces sp. NPDC050485]|uniref:hypothetical protein n=1 Tax=Streptomyces sp. NPDC050485 TaxID=3365617 RepID=UPI0037AEB70F
MKPGDRVSVLGGSAFAEVRTVVPHNEPGWVSVLLDTSCDGPALIRTDTVLDVRRPEPEPADSDAEDDGPDTDVTVELTVTEVVEYNFPVGMTVPARIAADPEMLHEHLAENEELWLDDLDVTGAGGKTCISVHERTLDQASLVETA